MMPTATYHFGKEYRYGFNGQEKDNEVAGSGNSYSAEFWQYDSRLGRRWNPDPIIKPWQSPYVTFDNNPIFFIDPSGAVAEGSDGDKAKTGSGVSLSDDELNNVDEKGTIIGGDLDEFVIAEENPNKIGADNTTTNQIFVDNRTNQEKITTFILNKLEKDPAFVGKLISNQTSLSREEKSDILIHFMQNRPSAKFFIAFGQAATLGAGLGAASSLGLFSGLSGVSASSLSITSSFPSLLATNFVKGQIGFGLGGAFSNAGAQLAFNGFSPGDINVTSVVSSFLFKNPFTGSAVGAVGDFRFNGGFRLEKKSLLQISTEISIGTLTGFAINGANNNIGFTKSGFTNFGIGTGTSFHLNTLNTGFTGALSEPK
ncbi:MAG: hypothetical protein K0B10_14990 [Vicingaceae bacterium]|nr:hypothetical protein [Vicingaceae bacterium]